MSNFGQMLRQTLRSGRLLTDELMSRHTTFRVGGPADYYVTPQNAGQAAGIVRLCQREQVPLTVIGRSVGALPATIDILLCCGQWQQLAGRRSGLPRGDRGLREAFFRSRENRR